MQRSTRLTPRWNALLLGALALVLLAPATASAGGPIAFDGAPKNAAECAAYVAEGNRLMGMATQALIAQATRPQTVGSAEVMPASPAPVAPGAKRDARAAGSGSARATAPQPGAGGAGEDASGLVARGSKLFHLGLTCEATHATKTAGTPPEKPVVRAQ